MNNFTTLACGSVLLLVVLGVGYRLIRGSGRADQALTAWSKQVRFSPAQLTALRSLWRWYERGIAPSGDPMQHVSTGEVADLLQKCSLDSAPSRLVTGVSERDRQMLLERLRRLGMDDIQAQLVMGMKILKLGPASQN